MRQIAIVVEGETEEAFVGRVLAPYLRRSDMWPTAIRVKTSQAASGAKFAGGGSWRHYQREILRLCAGHYDLVTTMIDFYGYPHGAPGWDCARPHRSRECAELRERAMAVEISRRSFIPHLMLHEFETYVFAAALELPTILRSADYRNILRRQAAEVCDDVELLDDAPATSPSHRIEAAIPGYRKRTDGPAIADEAGVQALMRRVPRLKKWVTDLTSPTR